MKCFFTTIGSIKFSAFCCKVFILCAIVIVFVTKTGLSQTVFTEDWEQGMGNWFASNGVWEVGIPIVGPPNAHSGQNVAGTILDGEYPNSSNTRLTSPQISLPNLSSGEKLKLRFWHWFNQFPEDPGVVQISEDNGTTWTTISNTFEWNSDAWTQYIVDISDHANSTSSLSFYFTSSGSNQANGWYVDDILIVKGVFTFSNPEDFELGIGDWFADKGV